MSSVAVESACVPSQLYFSFGQKDESESADRPDLARIVGDEKPPRLRPQSQSTAARSQQPQRMGTVMLNLLKSYGITDEEIAEGLQAYAQKTATAQSA